MASLEITGSQGSGSKVKFELEGESSVIGRSKECDVPLDVAAVSRRHAVVFYEGGRYFVEDLGSRNGTFLNDHRLLDRTPLRHGDRLLICDQTLRFQEDRPQDLLGGVVPQEESSLAQFTDDEAQDGPNSNVMATLDLSGGGSASWSLSAKPEVKLAALVEISNNLGQTFSVDAILPKLLDSLFKIFVQADRGFVIMRSKENGPLIPVATKIRRGGDEEKVRISRTIIEEALHSKKAILSADATSDERFSNAESIADFSIRSMICAPMIDSEGMSLGVIQIDTLNQRSRFTDEDLEVLAGIASQAAISIDNATMHEQVVAQRALQRDLELARQMQRALLPTGPPEVPGYYFFDYYESAREIGGDYYDYIRLPDDRFAVVVGDVAGKGVSAALLMARLSSDVRFSLAMEPDLALAIRQINDGFSRTDWQDKFVTMIVAVVDPHTNELTLVNAGHMPPLLRHEGGQVEEIGEDQAGLPLGVMEEYPYESYSRTLEPGDFLTIFTDGFSEAMNANRDLYGLERLAQQIGLQSVPTTDLGQHLLDDVRQFVDGVAQSDDMCLACFGREENR